jgi:hypothetical protein
MIRWLPVWAYLATYSVLCVIGSVLLFWHVEPFISAFEQFSGARVPAMTEEQGATFLIILFGGPAAFAIGYGLVIRAFGGGKLSVDFADRDVGRFPLLANALFYALLLWSLWSLYSGGAFSLLYTWSGYTDWVHARWTLFSSLNFFEFANIYMFLPTAAALVVLAIKPRRALDHATRWLPTLLTLGVDLMIFQKKPFLLTLLSSGGALWLSAVLSRPERIARYTAVAALACATLLIAYGFLVLTPYLLTQWGIHGELIAGREPPSRAAQQDMAERLGFGRGRAVVEPPPPVLGRTPPMLAADYAALSFLMRTPGPALYYPVMFPHRHPYYNLDLGQDILGFGSMPDDNHVVWRAMYPDTAGGATAPFNFVLYSQGGTAVGLIGTAVVGALVALCWVLALWSRGGVNTRSLLGVLLLLFVMHLSIDSLRNTSLVSYGFIWGGAFVLAAYVIENLLIRARIVAAPATPATGRE